MDEQCGGEANLVTIGITCFNAENTITSAIDSALAQTWPHKEVHIVDDASTDGSVRVIEERIRGVENVRLTVQAVNSGYAAALNVVVDNANGEFVAFFDDDDWSDPTRLEEQWGRLIEYESGESTGGTLCYTDRLVTHAEGHVARVFSIGRHPPEPVGRAVADFLLLGVEVPGCCWGEFGSCTLMARSETLRKIGRFDCEFRRSAEWDLAIRAGLLGMHFVGVPKALVRQYKEETSDKQGKIPLENQLRLRHKFRETLKGRNSYLASLASAHARFHYAKGRRWRARAWRGLAAVLGPHVVLAYELRRRWLG